MQENVALLVTLFRFVGKCDFSVVLLLCFLSAAVVGDWNNAAVHLKHSNVAIGSQYGEDSIEMGRQLFKLAQLHFNG